MLTSFITSFTFLLRVTAILTLLLSSAHSSRAQQAAPSPLQNDEPQTIEENDTIRIDTDLVDLQVTVFSLDAKQAVGTLDQKVFRVYENGVEQELSLFASAETPFDLVLLIDLSGSTRDKLSLIRKSAMKFVEATRSTDRVAILTFTDELKVVSPLTFNRANLKMRIADMEKPRGGTNFWDAVRYILETMLNPERTARRSAVVMMTDGVDNALPDVPGEGSRTSFEELLGFVSKSDSILIPIYLDTEREIIREHKFYSADAYAIARSQLGTLASESGSKIYYARKVEDLRDVYQQVVHDLSTVYSLGYRPINRTRDGLWRPIKVELANRPDLAARSRRGYFATQDTELKSRESGARSQNPPPTP